MTAKNEGCTPLIEVCSVAGQRVPGRHATDGTQPLKLLFTLRLNTQLLAASQSQQPHMPATCIIKTHKNSHTNSYIMKEKILDIAVGVSALIVFSILLFVLPNVMPVTYGYISALILFIGYLTVAGLTIIKKTIT
ncbi:MAG: hypothetical protein LBU24_05090 [Methanocalculaceae archaeon]|jgi:hypothetical protein|nr:hypothetical protein [Methanocalculaceae archaeon]